MKLIYVAGPYRGATPDRVRMHIESAKMTGLLMAEKGWYPVIPHANTDQFERLEPTIPDAFYLDGTLEMMRRCDAVVLCPGHERSSGTQGEIVEAKRLGMHIFYAAHEVPDAEVFDTWLREAKARKGAAI